MAKKNEIYKCEKSGLMDPKRILEITEMTKDVTAGKIFVTAFLDFKTYKKFAFVYNMWYNIFCRGKRRVKLF